MTLLVKMGLEFEPRTFSFKALVFVGICLAKTKLQLSEEYRTRRWRCSAALDLVSLSSTIFLSRCFHEDPGWVYRMCEGSRASLGVEPLSKDLIV